MEKERTEKDAPRRVKPISVRKIELPLLQIKNLDNGETRIKKRESRRDLVRALTEAIYDDLVPFVAFYYDKDESKEKGRVANEDYVSLPNAEDNFHMGQIVQVARSKRGNIYFKLKDLTRGDGIEPWSWTSIRPDRITFFQYRGSFASSETKSRAGNWTGRRPITIEEEEE